MMGTGMAVGSGEAAGALDATGSCEHPATISATANGAIARNERVRGKGEWLMRQNCASMRSSATCE